MADASQKLTCPTLTPVLPDFTVAVSVTTLPEATDPPDAIPAPPELIAKVVVVAEGKAQTCEAVLRNIAKKGKHRNDRWRLVLFTDGLQQQLLRLEADTDCNLGDEGSLYGLIDMCSKILHRVE